MSKMREKGVNSKGSDGMKEKGSRKDGKGSEERAESLKGDQEVSV